MSIKDALQGMHDFMKANPAYRPSKLVVVGSEKQVLRTLRKHGLSQSLTLNGVPIECKESRKAS